MDLPRIRVVLLNRPNPVIICQRNTAMPSSKSCSLVRASNGMVGIPGLISSLEMEDFLILFPLHLENLELHHGSS